MPGTAFRRYQNELFSAGYIKVKSGKQATGYQYEIVSYEEYRNLKAGIETVLDEALQQLKQATAPVVSHSGNGSPKKQVISGKAAVSQ